MNPLFAMTVKGNPLPKARARSGKGRHYTPETTRWAEDALAGEALAHMNNTRTKIIEREISVEVHFYRENARRCDLDNLAKLTQDSCNGIVWKDDSQIVRLVAEKKIDKANPRTIIAVWPA